MILNFDNQLLQQALQRVDELQNEMIEKSKQIEGAKEYVEQKMAFFVQDEAIRHQLKTLKNQEQLLTENFLKTHALHS